jgi:hypothetical protein
MVNYTQQCGRNAGKIWKTLETHGPLPKVKLLKNTRLDETNFFAAIGWLARENKIYKKGLTYGLGETNLVDTIGSNAGKVWTTLQMQQELDVSSLVKLTQLSVKDAYSAVGWLAREDKIGWNWNKTGNKQMIFRLK